MPKGAQTAVVTPGDNEKCYLAGSLHWRTGLLISTVGDHRDAALFVRHLEDLCRHLRRYKKIHIICDNAKSHPAWAVQEFYAKHVDRIEFDTRLGPCVPGSSSLKHIKNRRPPGFNTVVSPST